MYEKKKFRLLHSGVDQRFETENHTPTTVSDVEDVPPGRDQTVRGCAAFRQTFFRGKQQRVFLFYLI